MVNHWIRSYHLHLFEVLDKYYIENKHFWHDSKLSFLPISSTNSVLEFRIFHSIFCENYNIDRKAFSFDQYVYRKFEKFLLKILHIDERNWGIVLVLVLGNWLRWTLDLDLHECMRIHRRLTGVDPPDTTLNYSRMLAGAGAEDIDYETAYACDAPAAKENFIIAGWVMVFFCFILAVFSRLYELRVMRSRGIENSNDYVLYLTTYEDDKKTLHDAEKAAAAGSDGEASGCSKQRLTETQLKEAITRAKDISDAKKNHSLGHSFFDLQNLYSNMYDSYIFRAVTKTAHKRMSMVRRIFGTEDNYSLDDLDEESMDLQKSIERRATIRQIQKKKSEMEAAEEAKKRTLIMKTGSKAVGKLLRRVRINREHKAEIGTYVDDEEGSLKAEEDFDKIYAFGKPEAYFQVVEVFIMPIAFYIAMWISNYVALCRKVNEDASRIAVCQVSTIFPGICCVILYLYIVKVAALLGAVTHCDNDAMLEIIEQTEGTRLLGQQMRTRMLEKLTAMGDPEGQLKTLFNEIDENDSNLLSRSEFQIFLETLGISFSRKKWSQIFAEIDLNNDDEISFKELFLFLFPDNDTAKLEETRRLKRIGQHARKLAQEEGNALAEKQGVNTRKPGGALKRGFTKEKVVVDAVAQKITDDMEAGSESGKILPDRDASSKKSTGGMESYKEEDNYTENDHTPSIADIEDL